MAKGKFSKQADDLNDKLATLLNRAVKRAVVAGINAAAAATVHDSSNAAVHWMVGVAQGRSGRPASRSLGKLKDLRGTLGRRKKGALKVGRRPVLPVGYRGDEGVNKDLAVKFVTLRERSEVIDKLVVGRNPPTKFYFYHALAEGRAGTLTAEEADRYRKSAEIDAAGNAAVAAAIRAAEAAVTAGLGRKPRK